MHPVISRLLIVKGFFLGGFVRDFLIRGEKFQDIDYSFHYPFALSDSDATILNQNEIIRLDDSEESKRRINGLYFHYCPTSYYYDLSCNLFGFDKDGFFPLPSYHLFDLNKAWELILDKKFYKLCDGKLTTQKMLRQNWEMVGEIQDKENQIIHHDRNGIWNDYNKIAKQRLNELVYR